MNKTCYVVTIVPADGLAPLGARPSDSTMLTKFKSHVHPELALVGIIVALKMYLLIISAVYTQQGNYNLK